MRVVTTDENYHTVLHPGRVNEVEVIEQTPIVCKVLVRGMVSPLKFQTQIKQTTNASGVRTKLVADMKVYMSLTHKEPGESAAEKVATN